MKKRWISTLTAAVMLLRLFPSAFFAIADEVGGGVDSADVMVADIAVPEDSWEAPQGIVPLLHEAKTSDGTASVSVPLEMAANSRYGLRLTYAFAEGTDPSKSTVTVQLDGKTVSEQAADIPLACQYENASSIRQDSRGNDILPSQKVSTDSVVFTLCDTSRLNRLLAIDFPAGQHTLTLLFKEARITLTAVELVNRTLLTYEEYRAKCPRGNSANAFEEIQAEDAVKRTVSSLLPGTDRSGPATVPNDPIAKKLNVISADRWKEIGAALTWNVTVPSDGRYRIGLRWKQSTKEGLATSRALYVDGEIPFAEAAELKFPYNGGWQYTTVGDGDGEPYEFYLTAGTHTLTLEAVSGQMTDVIASLQDTVYQLNTLYRRIIMVTGVTPDAYRDYDLFTNIDGLQDSFAELSKVIADTVKDIGDITGLKGGQVSILSVLQKQLEEFSKDDMTISERLSAFKNNIVATASLMTSLYEQPLDLDYITLSGESSTAEPTGLHTGFFKKISYHATAFFGSFVNDYSAVGDDVESSVTLTAWYNGGREQAEILKQMVDGGFTEETGIGVELQLVTISLSQAILAGTAPDVLLSTSRGQPVNLGIRGVLTDVSKLKGYEELKKEYTAQAFVPYTCRGAVYGVPVTMNFHMMFVRTDIFDEMDLKIPDTWNDFDTIIARLQRANMTIGLPYSVMSSAASIEAGMGCKDIFSALLLQNGGRIYNDELTATVLDEETTMAAFRRWVTFYTEYQLDTEYNFYNRFRTGEMPIGICDYSFYNTLQAATPELKGLWTMMPIPGTVQADGTVDRTEATSGSACVILKDSKHISEAWKLTKWWCSAPVQGEFGNEVELLMGEAARYAPANRNAMSLLPWSTEQLSVLNKQMDWLQEIPEVIGGYYTARGLDNAFRNVLFNAVNYRESLLEQMDIINTELTRKQKEFS